MRMRLWNTFGELEKLPFPSPGKGRAGAIGLVLTLGMAFAPLHTLAAVSGAFVEGFSGIIEKVGPAVVNVAVTVSPAARKSRLVSRMV